MKAGHRRLADARRLLLGALLLIAWDASPLDMLLIAPWADGNGFALRDHWLLRCVLHEGGRWLAGAMLGLLALNVWRPLWPRVFGRLDRGERWRWLVMTLAALLLVPAIKRLSPTSCPWDLWAFGGLADHLSHWRGWASDAGPGHCFPSGHAVSALAFTSGWFVLRERHPGLARGWLAVVLLLALVFGSAQMLRGAHFASHTLWSAWACWALCSLLDATQGLRGFGSKNGASTKAAPWPAPDPAAPEPFAPLPRPFRSTTSSTKPTV